MLLPVTLYVLSSPAQFFAASRLTLRYFCRVVVFSSTLQRKNRPLPAVRIQNGFGARRYTQYSIGDDFIGRRWRDILILIRNLQNNQ